ncbi:hypothetical protein ACRAWC_01545 [Leifsonia sp. L25]|uniref:hypothetical protein n=1 Tax=Actinomycetes TaxID=1760 RepID=UPI003D681480
MTDSVRFFEPVGVEVALARFRESELDNLHGDAAIEGFDVSRDDVAAFLAGRHVAGLPLGHAAQLAAMKRARDLVIARVEAGEVLDPSKELSDQVHDVLAAPFGLKSNAFRGDQRERYDGPRVQLGGGKEFRALDARLTQAVLDAGLERILALEHPILRATTWAAFATYEQFYFDANRRTARLVMNAGLLSHGYDAIVIPAEDKMEFLDSTIATYWTGQLTHHLHFLVTTFPSDRTDLWLKHQPASYQAAIALLREHSAGGLTEAELEAELVELPSVPHIPWPDDAWWSGEAIFAHGPIRAVYNTAVRGEMPPELAVKLTRALAEAGHES